MLIEIQCSANLAKHAKDWLCETYRLIDCADRAYDLLVADRSSWVDDDLRAMGVSPNEGIVYALDEILGNIELPYSYEVMKQGTYGSGMAVQKYLNGFTAIDYVIMTIRSKSDYAEPLDEDELSTLKSNLYQALGDLIYAFGRVLFSGRNPKVALVEMNDYIFSQDIQAFLASVGRSAEEVAMCLVGLQCKYITTIPLFDNDPESWIAITKELDPSLVDMMIDYGTYITSLDVRAVKKGLLQIDENFVDLIQERAETPEHILNQAPVKWEQFIELIPDEEILFFEQNEFKITSDIVDVALADGALTPEYVKTLHQMMNSTPEVNSTNVFRN